MIELRHNDTFLRLSETLDMLEYGSASRSWKCANPIRLDMTGYPVRPENIREKKITVEDGVIRIEMSDFFFSARFPGNTYCRPDARFAPDLRLTVSLRLDGDDLVINASPIENLGQYAVRLMLAPDLIQASAQEEASLVIPYNYGVRFDFPRRDIFSQTFTASAAWSLPVHGLFTPRGGIGLWCEDPDREYVVSYNDSAAATVNAFCRELYDDMANEPRELRYMLFAPGEDFRALAGRCRALRIASGRFKTLEQKGREHPAAALLPGTVFWKHNVFFEQRPEGVEKTWSLYVGRSNWNENEGLPGNWTAAEVFETAKARGFDRVAVCNTGWNNQGFDAGYPTRLPVNPERGSNASFKAAAQAAQALSPGYFLNVHDNYIDCYEGPEFDLDEMQQKLPGNPERGGIWRGGQSYRMCSANGLKYAKRDLPQIAALSGPGCIYIDVSGGVSLVCCRSKLHPQTRRQDWETKRELFSLAVELFGALALEDCGTDHYADIVTIGAYGGLYYVLPRLADGPLPVPVPLWQMVYHDCVLNYLGEGYLPIHGSEYKLYQALYTLLPTSFDDNSKRLSFDLRSAYTAAMVAYEEIEPLSVTWDPDGACHTRGVARSSFSDGTQVVVNFNDEAFVYNDETIAPREYLILKA